MMNTRLFHEPVLADQLVALLRPALDVPAARIVDATVGLGGHAARLLQAALPDARLLGIDQDPESIDRAAEVLAPCGDRVVLRWANFERLSEVAAESGFAAADAMVFDLGVSSPQLDDAMRGFSFLHDGPLDMRMDPTAELSATQLLNHLSERRLADLIYEYGEERHSRRIARSIVARRPLHTTRDLAAAVLAAVPFRPDGVHPATRTFQAIRIAVNDELDRLRAVLPQAVALLRPGGRIAVISFHSLEDRIVKDHFRVEASDCVCPPRQPVCTCNHRAVLRLVTRRVVVPDEAEVARNPRARSARLRVAERLSREEAA